MTKVVEVTKVGATDDPNDKPIRVTVVMVVESSDISGESVRNC